MLFNRKPKHIQVMPVEHLKSFSDEIFGFSMTLLITRIVLPNLPVERASELLPGMLLHQWRHFAVYATSFLSIGGYWIIHHNVFDVLQNMDRRMIWLNLLFLLTVTFLALPTGLMGKYGRDSFTATLYGVTISVNYAMLLALCCYACSNDLYLKPNVDQRTRRLLQLRVAAPLVVAIIGTIISFFYFRLSFLVYFLVVIVNGMPLTLLAKRLHMIDSIESEAQDEQ
jgi:uncharacterized membrane protein